MRTKNIVFTLALASLLGAGPASAALSVFQTFLGNVGYSSDGFGSLSQNGTISADVPAGSTVLAAYLYTSMYSSSGGGGGSLAGSPVAYGAAVVNPSNLLSMQRANVTAIVKPLIDGGAGGVYNFSVTETNSAQDGEALVVVYQRPAVAPVINATFGILDGFSLPTGDSTAINFANPLNPAAPGFFAEMALGIGFSCCNQESTVAVNGTTITTHSGNNDDGAQVANGSLITVGGFNDPFSPLLPSYAADHERYNLTPYITAGDTTIAVNTKNPSGDDNIFLAQFYVSGSASINEPPPPDTTPSVSEPATVTLLGLGIMGLALRRRRHG